MRRATAAVQNAFVAILPELRAAHIFGAIAVAQVNDGAEPYLVGTTIAGRYQVERLLGEGNLGSVVLARHVNLDEKVAIKFLRPELRKNAEATARLSRESRVLARIKSDRVPRVLDVGVTLAAGPFMVMEYLQGTDMAALLASEGPLPVERVVEIALQVCEALTVAHTAEITHGDLQPKHLFLARHGQFETLKVFGFGLHDDKENAEKAPESSSSANAQALWVPIYGTPAYMSPERVRRDPKVDHRTDIWSMGVVMHELVTGRVLFAAPTLIDSCARILANVPLELEPNEAVLPASLRAVIVRCLERDPERRYQNVEELAAALAPLATMQERFRGRSTGAFSRKFVEEQLALSKTQRLQLPPSNAPAGPGEISGVLRDVATALRWVARSVLHTRIYEKPLWLYGGVALASALAVVTLTALGSNVRWVSPPPPSLEAVSLAPGEKRAVHGLDEPMPGLGASPEMPGAPADGVASLPAWLGTTASARIDHAPSEPEAPRAAPAPAHGQRPPRTAEVAPPVEVSSEPPTLRRRAHEPRRPRHVRLVEDKLLTNQKKAEAARAEGDLATEREPPAAPGSTSAPPLPEWLELMRSGNAP